MALLGKTILCAAAVTACALAGAAGLEAEPLSVATDVDRRVIAIGDTVSLLLDLVWESGVEVKPVAVRENLGDFIVRDVREGAVRPEDGGFGRRVSILLTVFEVGEHTIPPVPILFKATDGGVGRVETEPVDVVVETVLAEEAGEIRDIKPPLSVRKKWKEILLSYALLIGLAGAAATSVLVSVRKKSEIEVFARRVWDGLASRARALAAWVLSLFGLRPEPEPETYEIEVAGPDIDPAEAALEELARIEALGLIEKGLIKDFYTLISEVLRRYIERKYGVLAMELPTTFIVRAIVGRGLMSGCRDRVRELLEVCDLVKFARHVPPDETTLATVGRARDIVLETAEPRREGVDLEA